MLALALLSAPFALSLRPLLPPSAHSHSLQQPFARSPPPSHAAQWAVAAAMSAALQLTDVGAAVAALPPGKQAVDLPALTKIVTEDFTQRRYLVTGDLTRGVYADDARFADSNNDFGPGLDSWVKGVKALFVSDRCRLALTGPVVADAEGRTIFFSGWRQVDVFRLPGAPHTPVFTGTTTLTLDPIENIVVDHTEVWDQKPNEIVSNLKFFDPKFDPPGFD
uniref:SnoaL-like domain-containing protein n=1 Tax=Corethron hystrix TaxID=216773 RepID=A0A7S1BSY8_9STRA|mmetsp:Transcript_37372/g.87155  ORF Transcript_37372/g.87155 Transcript_37372/m.87155 type:complete len:221 (+) Transcript_37372:47-709(+)